MIIIIIICIKVIIIQREQEKERGGEKKRIEALKILFVLWIIRELISRDAFFMHGFLFFLSLFSLEHFFEFEHFERQTYLNSYAFNNFSPPLLLLLLLPCSEHQR